MNNKIKRNLVISALLALMIFVSLTAGATLALLTSKSNVNIAVNSGKVSVVASVDASSVQTKELYDTEYTHGASNMFGGKATFNETGLIIENFVPGDGIKFNIVIKNESTINIKYRTIIGCENDNGLFEALSVTIGNEKKSSGATFASSWAELLVGSEDAIVSVSIELPEDVDNEYFGKTCTLTYIVEAIQGNAYTGPTANITKFAENDLPVRTPISGSMGGITFPTAPDEIVIESAWSFAATDTEETIEESLYKDWICDFVIECDGNVELGELGLWGAYGGLDFAFANPLELPEGQSLFMMTSVGMPLTYEDVCLGVQKFDCGVFRGLAGEQMQGKTITVSLCLINPEVAEKLIEEIASKPENQDKGEDEILLEVMKKENWGKYVGSSVLIANQTTYCFN